jgi:hypothetical protein
MRDLSYFRGASTHVRRSAYRMYCCGGLQHADRRLAKNEKPPLGAHLLTPRFGFTHHGIYVGEGKVIHYGPLSRHVLSGPVAEVPLVCFSSGRPTWLRRNDSARFTREEVIARARSRVGENVYHVLRNNCEHFCEWCLHDQHRSYQVEKIMLCARQLHLGLETIMKFLRAMSPTARSGAKRSRRAPHLHHYDKRRSICS